MRRFTDCLLVGVMVAMISLTLAVLGEGLAPIKTIPSTFRMLKIVGDAVLISDPFQLGRISSSGSDVVTNWTNTLTFRVGETVRQQGGQSNEYWEILEIENCLVKMHHFGFVKGIGDIDEVVWIRESESSEAAQPVSGALSPPSFLRQKARAGVSYEIGIYVVTQGDTPFSIVKRHGLRSVAELLKLNPRVKDKALVVGQQLRIYERPF